MESIENVIEERTGVRVSIKVTSLTMMKISTADSWILRNS